jgi:hypothetical protein
MAALFRRWCVSLFLLLGVSLHTLAVPLPAPPVPVNHPVLAPSLAEPVVFTAYDTVDLLWEAIPEALVYRVKRDGAVVYTGCGTTFRNQCFWRNSGLQKGHSYTFQVCWDLPSGSSSCTSTVQAVTDALHGLLYQSYALNQEGETYLVSDADIPLASKKISLLVMENAVLSVSGNVTVTNNVPYEDAVLWDGEGGITVVGNELARPRLTALTLYLDGSSSALQGVILENTHVHLCPTWAGVPCTSFVLSGSQFNSGLVWVWGGKHQIINNTFDDNALRFPYPSDGQALISGNTFLFNRGAKFWNIIELSENASAAITGNTFQGKDPLHAVIEFNGGSGVIEANQFNLAETYHGVDDWTPSAIFIWPGMRSEVAIKDNLFQGLPGACCRYGVHVWLKSRTVPPQGYQEGAPTWITLQGNTFPRGGFTRALYIRDGDTHLEATENIFAVGRLSFLGSSYLDPHTDTLRDNCILEHVDISTTNTINAAHNWWGASAGPYVNAEFYYPRLLPDSGVFVHLSAGTIITAPLGGPELCPPQVTDLKPVGMEIVQVVQNVQNTIPLAAGKRTLVRGYLQSNTGELAGVSAVVRVYHGDALACTVSPVSGARLIYLPSLDDSTHWYNPRSAKSKSFQFWLPAGCLLGSGRVELEVNPSRSLPEQDYGNNTLTQQFAAVQLKTLEVGLLPLRFSSGGKSPQAEPGVPELLQMSDFFRKIYPGSDIRLRFLPGMEWSKPLEGDFKAQAELMNRVGLAQVQWKSAGGWDEDLLHQVFGALPVGATYAAGIEPAYRNGRGAAGWGEAQPYTFAHVLAQNLGNQPNPKPWIECSSSTTEIGYDTQRDEVLPRNIVNVLGCAPPSPLFTPIWIEAQDYQELVQFALQSSAAQPAPAAPAPQSYLVVSGVVNPTGQAELSPAWQVSAGLPPDNPPEGTGHCVELRSAAEAVLASLCFDLVFPNDVQYTGFIVALPLSGSPARIVLRKGTSELASLAVSAHAPTVSFSSVTRNAETAGDGSGSMTVSWSAADQDGGGLAFNLSYSADGGATWLPLAVGLDAQQYMLDLGKVPASADARLRVEASDGYNRAEAQYGPFSVAAHAPEVTITHPAAGAVVSETLVLQGFAYDQEDGELGGAQLAWTDEQGQALGSGQGLPVTLAAGMHTLTLTARDTSGRSAATTVSFRAGAPPPQRLFYLPYIRK